MNQMLIETARKIADGWSQCDGYTAAADWINALCDELENPAANWMPCAEGLPEQENNEDLFRVFVQRTTKSGKVLREFAKEATFRYGKWISPNGFIIGSSGYDPYKETVVAYHRVPAFYRADQYETTEKVQEDANA